MKSAILIFCFTLLASQLTEATTGTAVLDVSRSKVRPGTDYYILPVIRGRGGGLTLASRNGSCPLNVVQEGFEVANGLPMKFYPIDPKAKVVTLSTDMNVVFSGATICVQSTVWRLQFDEATGRRYVGTGGVIGNPGISTLSNWFKLDKMESSGDYKLVFCPGVCNFCKVICSDVGVFVENGKRWLGLTESPFPVMIKRA